MRVRIFLFVSFCSMISIVFTSNLGAEIYDDFNGSEINPDLWYTTNNASGLLYQANGFLSAASPPYLLSGCIDSKIILSGDFEVILPWSSIVVIEGCQHHFSLNISDAFNPNYINEAFIYISHDLSPGEEPHPHVVIASCIVVDEQQVDDGFLSFSSDLVSGLFKITRVGSTVNVFYDIGSGWVLLSTASNAFTCPVIFSIYAQTGLSGLSYVGSDFISIEVAPLFKIIKATMVSPNELGIGIEVEYPEYGQETTRNVKFSATINEKYVEKIFDITEYTVPGEVWGPGQDNQMFDGRGNLEPTTPLRINLADEGVDRFTENETFELAGVAYCDGGPESDESKIDVEIPLPVVVLHGYPFARWYGGRVIPYEIAYEGLKDFLVSNGYNNEDMWDNYNIPKYRTLWDPSDFAYTDPKTTASDDIEDQLDGLLSEVEVWEHNYASKVSFIGHSFGGLVARYYSSVRPENVSRVITVGTPHTGATLFFKTAFSMSREEFENTLQVRSILRWAIPTYDCTYLKEKKTIQYIDPSTISTRFENTLTAGPAPGIEYYSIFGSECDTDKKLFLVETDGWYKKRGKIEPAPGDGLIIAESASAFGTPIGPIPGKKKAKHADLLNHEWVQNNILDHLR